MAFVDLDANRLILKAVMAGPPATGKTTRLEQVGRDERGLFTVIGSDVSGRCNVARLHLETESSARPVTMEIYEWHGPERADARNQALFKGLDGLIYLADAREDRFVDTVNVFDFLLKTAGKSRIQRIPALLMLGRTDEGLLQLPMIEKKLEGATWSQSLAPPIEEGEPFLEALRVFGEVMMARVL